MTSPGDIRLPPWNVREQQFFILYRDDPDIPAVQIQLADGRTYDIYSQDFGRVPQFTKLERWEECLSKACAEGQAVYCFGETPDKDEVLSAPSESRKNEPVTIARRLRENAIRHTRTKGLQRGFKNISPRRYSAFRYHKR